LHNKSNQINSKPSLDLSKTEPTSYVEDQNAPTKQYLGSILDLKDVKVYKELANFDEDTERELKDKLKE